MKERYSRTTLNDGQILILELLYKYRFGSRQLLANSLGIKAGSGLHEKLDTLHKNGFVGKRLDKRMKLYGMPVAYFLLPKGLRALQALPGHEYIDDRAMRLTYKDKTVTNDFILQTLNIYKYTQLLHQQYPGLKVYTKRDIVRYDYFPIQPPDAFLSLPQEGKPPLRYFFDLVSDRTPRYILDKRIATYAEFFEEGGWDKTGSALPALLLLSEWGPAEMRIQRSAHAQLSRVDSELRAYTTTVKAIERPGGNTVVWTAVDDPDELRNLEAIFVSP